MADRYPREFYKDIHELLGKGGLQCREDALKAEFEKASNLLENATPETTYRAYDIMTNLVIQFAYTPAIMWLGDFAKDTMKDLTHAVKLYKKAASLGDENGYRCYADMLMACNDDAKDIKEITFAPGEFLRYTDDIADVLYKQAYCAGNTQDC